MKFIDEVDIKIQSGNGGNGIVRWRREKYIEFGGPEGGNGGRGGHIIFQGDENFNTLMHFRGKKVFSAPNGEDGGASQMTGANGQDLILRVPPGTLVYHQVTGDLICDITEHGQTHEVLEGGRGGMGNAYFQTSTNQAPRYAQKGEPGQSLPVRLELKLLADVALIGLPNAGKSTLISSISSSKPKIADYPFTTLEPNLGVVSLGDKTFVVADIPGLIENASEGKGLGIKFLKHIERTHALVHLIDCSMLIDEFEVMDHYQTIRTELQKYSEGMMNKREIICLTKIDAMTEEEIERFRSFMEEALDKKVLPISAVSGRNIDLLKQLMLKTKEQSE